MDSLVTTAAKALDAKLSIVCDHHACDGRCDSAGCVDIRGAAEVVVGAVLAALREQSEPWFDEAIAEAAAVEDNDGLKCFWEGFEDAMATAKQQVLALLAVVENDQPKCPECNGTGVREISSSGDSETGFEREWDACDCGRVPGVNTGATDTPRGGDANAV